MELTVKQTETRGRKRVDGGRTRKQLLQVRLSDEEHTCLLTKAQMTGTDKNKLVRGWVLQYIGMDRIVKDGISVNVGESTIVVSKEEAKQLLKSLTEQLLN